MSAHGEVRPFALEIADGEGAGAAAERGAGGSLPLQQAPVESGAQEAGVAVLLHQPVHRALRRIKGAAQRLPDALACDFLGVKVQVHLEEEEKDICLIYVHAYPVLFSIFRCYTLLKDFSDKIP